MMKLAANPFLQHVTLKCLSPLCAELIATTMLLSVPPLASRVQHGKTANTEIWLPAKTALMEIKKSRTPTEIWLLTNAQLLLNEFLLEPEIITAIISFVKHIDLI